MSNTIIGYAPHRLGHIITTFIYRACSSPGNIVDSMSLQGAMLHMCKLNDVDPATAWTSLREHHSGVEAWWDVWAQGADRRIFIGTINAVILLGGK